MTRLILEYKETSGGIHKIILDPLKTEASLTPQQATGKRVPEFGGANALAGFRLDDTVFEKLVLDENGPLFYSFLKNLLPGHSPW